MVASIRFIRLVFASSLALAILPTAARASAVVTVPGMSNPWLAGMPNGARDSGDSAPAQSPVEVKGVSIVPGTVLQFSAEGAVAHDPSLSLFGPDGISIAHRNDGSGNGIGDLTSPFDSLVGVFLGPDRPDLTPAPDALTFEDYSSLSPLLKQTFFIGDGQSERGIQQQVITPAGATRLFLGIMDSTEWRNNVGSFTVRVTPEPSSIVATAIATLSLFRPPLTRRSRH